MNRKPHLITNLPFLKLLIRALHTPVVEQVVEKVHGSYSNDLPGLPYPELPVICITSES